MLRLFDEEPIAKVHIFRNLEIAVSVEKLLSGLFTLPVFIVSSYVPFRIARISINSQIIRNIRNYKLSFRDSISLIILKVIMI